MIHLVCYTHRDSAVEQLKSIFPPNLSLKIFTQWKELQDFLNSLKIPTQLIIDLEEHPALHQLPMFFKKNQMHHMICMSFQFDYAKWCEYMGYGAALVTFDQLMSLSWWWNRTTIQTSRAQLETLFQKNRPVALMSSPQSLQKTYWPTLLAAHQNRAIVARTALEMISEPSAQQWCSANRNVILICTTCDQASPYHLKQKLRSWIDAALQNDILLCLDLQSSQVDFESMLDWMTAEYHQGLHRLQLSTLRSKRLGVGTTDEPVPLSLEYVRYTWLAGQKCL